MDSRGRMSYIFIFRCVCKEMIVGMREHLNALPPAAALPRPDTPSPPWPRALPGQFFPALIKVFRQNSDEALQLEVQYRVPAPESGLVRLKGARDGPPGG